MNKNKNDNGQILDTFGNNDEKEGIADIAALNKNIGCTWYGKLNDLLNTNHLETCTIKYNPLYKKNITIKILKNENKKLIEIISELKKKDLKLENELN